ncbi:MAG TPA: ATP-binding protein [Mycobacteriales bacterium]|jgi:signal transduction histidine kinase|nr:ATP-binding protein [Mycobacteriales bacterium]
MASTVARELVRPVGRTTLRWRLTLVYGAVAVGVGLLLLLLSILLVNRATQAGSLPVNGVAFVLDGRVVTVAQIQDGLRHEALRQLYRQGLLALFVLGAFGVALSYVLAGRILRPLHQITATARRLSAEQLDERIDLPGPEDELKELADVFDAMLERLQAAFEAQRRFVADASHELRTPLAVMRTEVDVALADPGASTEDLRAAAVVVREATQRADRLVDSLLLLARSDRLSRGGLPLTERVELSAVAAAGLLAVRSEVVEEGLTVDVGWGAAPVLGDPGLLERLAGNLVENAVRHNVPGGRVHAATGSAGGRAWLEVSNTGAEIPAAEVEQLFEPFRRYGTARTARRGAGLGLSIVQALVRAHGGVVTATPRPGGGLVVRVELPAVAVPADAARPTPV